MSDDEQGGDVVSRGTMSAVARARARAAAGPSAEEIAELLDTVARRRTDLTSEDIRALGAVAVRQANRVSYLLGRLSGLLEEPGDE